MGDPGGIGYCQLLLLALYHAAQGVLYPYFGIVEGMHGGLYADVNVLCITGRCISNVSLNCSDAMD